MKICPKCGVSNETDAKFCVNCGASLKDAVKPQKKGKKLILILVIIVIVLVGVLAFVFGMNQKPKPAKPVTAPAKTEKAVPKTQTANDSNEQQQSSQAPASSASTVTASNYSDGQLATLVAYYGSTCGENDWDAWSTMEQCTDDGGEATLYVMGLNDVPVNPNQKGNGKYYAFNDQGGNIEFYTLSPDGKTVYIYHYEGDSDIDNKAQVSPFKVVSVQDLVNKANSDSMMDDINKVGNNVSEQNF
ncbi:zinc ribbon domain-containing protein [Ligilactobacillus aviarius]|uniref:zinc ribbon domain-containing protein n=1 Tax=Ligilactobacillus aviarius TaxID=1606 RepID=UPI0024BB855D|nr:zinc ribbon domain-containing protein [Ligilactobacillus aviarius]